MSDVKSVREEILYLCDHCEAVGTHLSIPAVREVVKALPDPATAEDCKLYREMIDRLEQAGLCRYKFHLLGMKFFGEKLEEEF